MNVHASPPPLFEVNKISVGDQNITHKFGVKVESTNINPFNFMKVFASLVERSIFIFLIVKRIVKYHTFR